MLKTQRKNAKRKKMKCVEYVVKDRAGAACVVRYGLEDLMRIISAIPPEEKQGFRNMRDFVSNSECFRKIAESAARVIYPRREW